MTHALALFVSDLPIARIAVILNIALLVLSWFKVPSVLLESLRTIWLIIRTQDFFGGQLADFSPSTVNSNIRRRRDIRRRMRRLNALGLLMGGAGTAISILALSSPVPTQDATRYAVVGIVLGFIGTTISTIPSFMQSSKKSSKIRY